MYWCIYFIEGIFGFMSLDVQFNVCYKVKYEGNFMV